MNWKMKMRGILSTKIGKAVFIAVMYVLIWGSFFAVSQIFAEQEYVALIYVALFVYFGWKALNRITPKIFLILPGIGWVIYFVFKGLASLLIGMFVAPFVISKRIADRV